MEEKRKKDDEFWKRREKDGELWKRSEKSALYRASFFIEIPNTLTLSHDSHDVILTASRDSPKPLGHSPGVEVCFRPIML